MADRTSPKTPYEIRSDLLQLAFNVLIARHAAIAVAENNGKIATSPTTDEIIEEAHKMNKFVSTGSTS